MWLLQVLCFDLVGPMYYTKFGSWQYISMHCGPYACMQPMKALQ
jgi:hypothetical protein